MPHKRSHPENSPWAVDVAQLGSRAGKSQSIDATLPAPSGIGDKVVGVKEGDPVKVKGSFDSIADGLVFAGTIEAPVYAECTRCLTPLNRNWNMDVSAFFPYGSSQDAIAKAQQRGKQNAKGEYDIIADEDESEDVYPLSPGDTYADFEALLRDTLVEGLPLQPLCKPDCRGLCPQCGVNLNDNPDHHHDEIDDRFSALAQLKQELENEQGA